ncbi:FeoB-associated Cys-rich membrane protein [Petralouisia muris]|uniref:FeoB-associated Cys-rich membrane protein n=1 Tax=Petralouisia muris TaxID=3032872 RepID=A0AC61S025_9FIRM|nr:FeoB-associated Cys-rich membrane protein [Petralouisia muris]TGY97583.1 FeoB-associated Cys-rich membrane protein [Petralouisia muris]
MGTFLVGAVVLAIAVCAGISVYKDKKAGRCSGCSGCNGSCPSCQGQENK